MGTGPLRRLRDGVDAVAIGLRRYRIWAGRRETQSSELSFLVVLLASPLLRSLDLPPGRAVASCIGLVVFGALFLAGQRLTPRSPLPLRVTLYGFLTVLSVLGMAATTSAWLVSAILTAISSANLLPLVWGAVSGVTAVTALSVAAGGGSVQAVLTVAAAGVIAVLRGRLLVEITQSRANRQAHAMAAVENERLRIARDLHDLLGHSLTTMVVKAELAERLAGRDPEASALAARDVQQVGRAAMAEVQQAVAGYRATSLAEEVEQARKSLRPLRNGVTVDIPPRTWGPDTDAVLAWGLREAVTNILRHANAASCTIGVTADLRTARLTVVNDDLGGAQIDTAIPGGGHGLAGLRERASELGGHLTATPLPGGGFRLALELPLDSAIEDRMGAGEGDRP
ncbi:sensor histidine kinase [Kitasatospora cystarginea]|uniref:Sensor histidine kinase n=1 Tax=Kitasatospora cystarginea TaxID=58350 RepID=A0ABN3F219_9ACTN